MSHLLEYIIGSICTFIFPAFFMYWMKTLIYNAAFCGFSKGRREKAIKEHNLWQRITMWFCREYNDRKRVTVYLCLYYIGMLLYLVSFCVMWINYSGNYVSLSRTVFRIFSLYILILSFYALLKDKSGKA